MQMTTIKLHIDQATRKDIESIYGSSDYSVIYAVVSDIFNRYMNAEYFNPELEIEDDEYFDICGRCGEKSKRSVTVDVDGTNLAGCSVCENCGSGQPKLE